MCSERKLILTRHATVTAFYFGVSFIAVPLQLIKVNYVGQ